MSRFSLLAGECKLKMKTGVIMNRIKKSIIALAAILMILAVPLSAAEMSVRWTWNLDDPAVTAYRYQLGGEEPDGWTELSGDTASIELEGLDAAEAHTLYLQRSYDGVNWSPSAVSTAKADLDSIPDVRIYRYGGYEMRAEIRTGEVTISYPQSVSNADAEAFFAVENEKYGLADIGITYSIPRPGTAVFGYPEEISRIVVAEELDVLVRDLVSYITSPAPAPVPVVEPEPVPVVISEPPIIREYTSGGYTISATIDTGATLLEYPAFVADDDVNTFFAVENEKYGLAELGVAYSFGNDGEVTVTYPESYSKETIATELDKLILDLIAYITTPAPVPVVVPEPEPEPVIVPEPPIVREYSHAGYTLIATIDTGKTVLVYPAVVTDDDVNAFFALENEKYGLAELGVSYSFGDDGEVIVYYPEEYSKEEVATELDKLVLDLIAYITAPAPEPVVVPEPVIVPELPIVRNYEYSGFILTATIDTGTTLLEYPLYVTDEEINTFFAEENEKYGLAELGVVYSFGSAGNVILTYPEEYSKEEVAAELDKLFADLTLYLPLVRVYEHEGYALTATINTGMTLLEYPEFITNEEVDTFFALENEKYGLAKLGVVYTFGNAGNVVLTYPSEYSKETVAAELDKMVEDLIAYITPAELPVIPVVPVVPVIPLEPAVAAEDESAFEFSLLLDAGVLSAFDNSFKFDDVIFANVGLGLNFANIISGGDHFGLGLRTDLDLSFLPKETGKWDLEDKLDYFNVFVYGEMISLDLKLMMDFYAGPADIYIGGGAGFAIGNPYDAEAIANYLGLDTFDIGQVRFAYDWFASATAGVRFRTSDLFSIGAEVNYRYMVTSQRHMGSANLIMGFTF